MSKRFLANENLPADIVRWLRQRGHDVLYAAESKGGAADENLLDLAHRDARIVLTFDRDFGELVFHRRARSAAGIVLFRLRQSPPHTTLTFMRQFFEEGPSLEGYFTVASPGQFRQTPLSGAATMPPNGE